MVMSGEMNASEVSFYVFTILEPWMSDGVKLKFLDKYFYENYRPYLVKLSYDDVVYEWMLDAHTVEYVSYDANNSDSGDANDYGVSARVAAINDGGYGDCNNIGRIDFGPFRRLKKLIFKGNGEYVYVPNPGVVEIVARNVILAMTDVSELKKLKLEYVVTAGALAGLRDKKETSYLPKLEWLEIVDTYPYCDLYLVGMPNLRWLIVSGYNIAVIDLPSLVAARVAKCAVPKEIRLPNAKGLKFTDVNITAIHAPELTELSCTLSEIGHLVTPKLKILFLLGCESNAMVPESVILFSSVASSCSNITTTRPVYLLTDAMHVLETVGPKAQNLYLINIQPGPHIPKGKKVTYVEDFEALKTILDELQKKLWPQ